MIWNIVLNRSGSNILTVLWIGIMYYMLIGILYCTVMWYKYWTVAGLVWGRWKSTAHTQHSHLYCKYEDNFILWTDPVLLYFMSVQSFRKDPSMLDWFVYPLFSITIPVHTITTILLLSNQFLGGNPFISFRGPIKTRMTEEMWPIFYLF